MERSSVISLVLIGSGAVLFGVGVFTPWAKGTPIPYAPGDGSPSARAAARTAQGYTSDSITVYEGLVTSINPDGNGSRNYHLSLASGAPPVYAQQQIDSPPPPQLSIGESVRVWTTTQQDAGGTTQNFVVRMDAGGSRWLAGYFSSPTFFEAASSPSAAALAFGGVPAGMALGLVGAAVVVRRQIQKSRTPWRAADHIALWSPAVSLIVFAAWLELIHSTGLSDLSTAQSLLPVVVIPPVVGLLAGIVGLMSRTPGTRLWPSLVGIVPGAVLLLMAGAAAFVLLVGGCRVVFC